LSANAEDARAWVDAFNLGDIDALLRNTSTQTEWVVARQHPASTTHRGPEAIAKYIEDWRAMMPGLTYEVDEILERDDLLLLVGRIRGSGAESGAAAEVPVATLTTFRDGLTLRVEEYLDPDEARAELERRASAAA
jgi:ketosteroid isomerase-like protein